MGASFLKHFMGLESAVQGLLVAVLVGLLIAKLRAPKLKLPPGTVALPIVGNWLQVSYTLLLHSSIFTNLQLHSEHVGTKTLSNAFEMLCPFFGVVNSRR